MNNKDIEIKSWYWTGSTESETGSMSGSGDSYKDPIWDSSDRKDSLLPEKSVLDDQEVHDFGGGIMSRVMDEDIDWDDLWEDDVYMDSEHAPLKLLAMLDNGDSILDVEMGDSRHAKFMSKRGFDVVGVDVLKNAIESFDNSNDIIKINGDVRYYNFGKKFDAFQALSVLEYIPNYSIAIKNIYSQLKPHAHGLIHISSSNLDEVKNIKKALISSGFNIIKLSKISYSDDSFYELIVEKNEIESIAKVTVTTDCNADTCPVSGESLLNNNFKYPFRYNNQIYNVSSVKNLSKLSSNPDKYLSGKVLFNCDVANRPDEKAAGLQVYPRLKNGSGLMFPYKKPTDVVYHMGSVRFPIDILFVGSDNRVKKIYKDIQPGSTAIFGCSGVSNVIEIGGGLSDRLGISIGNMVDAEIGIQHDNILIDSCHSYSQDALVFVKESSSIENRMYKFGRYNILESNKSAANITSNTVDIVKSLNIERKDAKIFDFRRLLNKDFNIQLFKGQERKTVLSGDFFSNYNIHDLSRIRKGPSGSYKNARDMLMDMDKDYVFKIKNTLSSLDNINEDIIFVFSDNSNNDLKREFLIGLMEDVSGVNASYLNPKVLSIPDSFNDNDIIRSSKSMYGLRRVSLFKLTDYVVKTSGISVSDDVKEQASKALDYFSSSLEGVEKLYSSLERNKDEYAKINGQQSLISDSRGQYNESCKRSKKVIEDTLVRTLDGIKVMNKIKDISTTMDIIDAIASSSKLAVDSVQEVFDLVDSIDSIDFISLLDSKTSGCLNLLDDYKESLKRMKNYINQDIIGVLVISE